MDTEAGLQPAPPVLTDAQRRSILRRCLASALRAGGFDELAAGEVPTTQPSSDRMTTATSLVVLLGFPLGIADLVNGPWWSWPLVGAGVLTVFSVISNRSIWLAVVVVLIGWPLTLWLQIRTDGHWLLTHVIPAGGLLVVGLITRQVGVRNARDVAVAVAAIPKAAPLVAPLVLVVLVLPSLSADVWKVADALDATRVVVLSAITVGLLFVLVVRQLRAELPQVLVARATALVGASSRVDETRDALRSRLRDETFELASAEADAFIADAWPADGAQYAEFIAASSRRKLTRPLLARLAVCALFIAGAVSVYLYALITVIVDPAVVAEWTDRPVPERMVDLFGLAVELPVGSYLAMTALLTCLAVATFLGFVLIEERFSVALGDALLRLPADRLLALALPFLHLTEERIVDGDPLSDDFDVGTFGEQTSTYGSAPSARDQPSGGADRTSST